MHVVESEKLEKSRDHFVENSCGLFIDKSHELGDARVGIKEILPPPNIIKNVPYAINKGAFNEFFRFDDGDPSISEGGDGFDPNCRVNLKTFEGTLQDGAPKALGYGVMDYSPG